MLGIGGGGTPSGDMVFLDFAVGGKFKGRIVFELFAEAPLAAHNFKALCTGELGIGRAGKMLCFKGSRIHRILPDFMFQGGDVTHFDGRGGESSFQGGAAFDDELDESVTHRGPGYLCMANSGPNTNKSQFYVTFVKTEWLDGKDVVFGRAIQGHWMLKEIEKCGSEDGTVMTKVTICDCGIYDPVKEALKEKIEAEKRAKLPKMFDDQLGIPDPYDPEQKLARSMYKKPRGLKEPLPLDTFEKTH